MGIVTNIKDLRPRRVVYKKEFPLISGGYSMRTAFPDGMVTVYPWDTEIDELLIEEAGKGGDEVVLTLLKKLVEFKGQPIDRFIYSEINSVLLVARAIQYGGNVTYTSLCPFCKNRADESLNIPFDLEPLGQKAKDYPGYDAVTLPISLDVVHIRPLEVQDHQNIRNRTDVQRTEVSDTLMHILVPIISVGGGKPETVQELLTWYNALSPEDARYLADKEMELSPRLNSQLEHKCDRCGHAFIHTLQFNQKFFRTRSGGESGPTLETNVRDGVVGKGVHAKSRTSAGSNS
jgi:hypothetical protein